MSILDTLGPQLASILDRDLLHRISLSYSINNILALNYLAKNGVHSIKMGLWRVGDEELGAIGALTTCLGPRGPIM